MQTLFNTLKSSFFPGDPKSVRLQTKGRDSETHLSLSLKVDRFLTPGVKGIRYICLVTEYSHGHLLVGTQHIFYHQL